MEYWQILDENRKLPRYKLLQAAMLDLRVKGGYLAMLHWLFTGVGVRIVVCFGIYK